MTKKKKPEKSKGPVTLGRSTFIDDILKKVESQQLVGPRNVPSRQPIVSLWATGSPSIAYAEVHNKTRGTE